MQHSANTAGMGAQATQPMHTRTGSGNGSGGANTMEPPEGTAKLSNNGLRRGASIYFKESARMLREIFEFIYLGQIAAVEDADAYGNVDKDEYNVWMFLLTWCAAPASPIARGSRTPQCCFAGWLLWLASAACSCVGLPAHCGAPGHILARQLCTDMTAVLCCSRV